MNSKIYELIIWIIIITLIIFITLTFLSHQCPELPPTNLTYAQIKHKMRTGDVILLNGNNIIRSNLIRAFIATNLTHAGIILRGKYDDSGQEKLFLMDISPFRGTHPLKIRLLDDVFDTRLHTTNCWLPLIEGDKSPFSINASQKVVISSLGSNSIRRAC